MKKLHKNYFNMTEVALTLALLAFGVASIISIFPIGLKATQNAIAANYSSDKVDQLVSYIRNMASGSTDRYRDFLEGIANTESNMDFSPSSANIRALQRDCDDFLDNLEDIAGGKASVKGAKTEWDNIFLIESIAGLKEDVFIIIAGPDIEQFAKDSTGQQYIPDFAGMVRIWKSDKDNMQINCFHSKSQSVEELLNTNRDPHPLAGINMEVSWPLQSNYDQREKRNYYFEIVDPGLRR